MAKTYYLRLRCIADYLTVIIVGIPLGILFVLCVALGRIKIRGYARAIRLAARGKIIIAANHPSMLETLLIPLLFFPFYLLSLRFFIWSVPDRRLLPRRLRWLFWLGRCITVDRSDRSHNANRVQKLAAILGNNGIIVIHPEAGRTSKGEKFIFRGDRRMRSFVSGVPMLARDTGATILPLWISGAEIVLPVGNIIPHLMRSRITLSFGIPYQPPKQKTEHRKESAVLARTILAS